MKAQACGHATRRGVGCRLIMSDAPAASSAHAENSFRNVYLTQSV
jgi:hypothetical protein